MKYVEEFTNVCASKEEWNEAYSEFLCEHTYDELPGSDILRWNYGMRKDHE